MHVIRYTPEMQSRWNEFVNCSANATFLHLRGYMDYHSDRFADCSLMAYDEKNRLVAVLPANRCGSALYSHQGLTYGGLLVGTRHFAARTMLDVWNGMLQWMRSEGIDTFIYKPVPHIYCRYPAEDDLYALFRSGAVMESCMVSSAIPLSEPVLFNEDARQRIKKAARAGVSVAESDDYPLFMSMLETRLGERYGVAPVHSPDEMLLLAGRFPDNIKLYMAYDDDGSPLAGTIVYLTDRVIHTQYISTTEDARRRGVFAAVVDHIIDAESAGRAWLDFGTSCEQGGRVLNVGLNQQKYGLGGRSVAYTSYRISL